MMSQPRKDDVLMLLIERQLAAMRAARQDLYDAMREAGYQRDEARLAERYLADTTDPKYCRTCQFGDWFVRA